MRGGSGSAAVCGTGPHRSSRASQEASAGPGGLRVVPLGTGGGGEVPLSSLDPPRRGVVATAVGGMGRVTVLGGVGPGGIRIRLLVRGGVAGTGRVAPGGRWGMRVERSVAAILFAGAVRARGVVARWGRMVGSGSGGGGVDEEQQQKVTMQSSAVALSGFSAHVSCSFFFPIDGDWILIFACPQERTEREEAEKRHENRQAQTVNTASERNTERKGHDLIALQPPPPFRGKQTEPLKVFAFLSLYPSAKCRMICLSNGHHISNSSDP